MSIAERLFRETQTAKSPLADIVEKRINAGKQVSFEDYMGIALYGDLTKEGVFVPGFYSGKDVLIGDNDRQIDTKKGDFTTSPESSPIFGFCIATQLLEMWKLMEKPKDFTVVEMGAGNGTLAYDILHGFKYLDTEASGSIRYLIVENSPSLIVKQKQKLEGLPVDFIEQSAVDLNLEIAGVFLSNELVDALPTHIVRRSIKGWEQLYIGKGNNEMFSENWGVTESVVLDYLDRHAARADRGDMLPVNLNGEKWMRNVAKSLKRGYVMTFDYESEPGKRPMRMFAAEDKGLENGRYTYLNKKHLGKFDITSDVDFQALADTGEENGLVVLGDTTQGGFLQGTGFHRLRDELSLLNDSSVTGGRKITPTMNYKFLRDFSSFRVLIQGKEVGINQILSGSEHTYHDLETEKRFKPLSPQIPAAGKQFS